MSGTGPIAAWATSREESLISINQMAMPLAELVAPDPPSTPAGLEANAGPNKRCGHVRVGSQIPGKHLLIERPVLGAFQTSAVASVGRVPTIRSLKLERLTRMEIIAARTKSMR